MFKHPSSGQPRMLHVPVATSGTDHGRGRGALAKDWIQHESWQAIKGTHVYKARLRQASNRALPGVGLGRPSTTPVG